MQIQASDSVCSGVNSSCNFNFPSLKCIYLCNVKSVFTDRGGSEGGNLIRLRNLSQYAPPPLFLSFSPTPIFSSFSFYPREERGLDQQAGVSSGGGAHVCQWREGERECVWWGLGRG